VAELVEYARGLGIGLSVRETRKAINAGRGVFFADMPCTRRRDRRQRVYRLRAKERVINALEADKPDADRRAIVGTRVILPDVAFMAGPRVQIDSSTAYTPGSVDVLAAALYDSYFYGNSATNYRQTLERKFGTTRQTLYRWELIAGIAVTPRYTEAAPPENEAEQAEYAAAMSARQWKDVDHRSLSLLMVSQFANDYTPGFTRQAPTGRTQHIKRHVATPDHLGARSRQGGTSRAVVGLFAGQGQDLAERAKDAAAGAAEYQSRHRDRAARRFACTRRQTRQRPDPRADSYLLEYSLFAKLFDPERITQRRNVDAAMRELLGV